MNKRDMAIAEAVRDAIVEKFEGEYTWLTNISACVLSRNINLESIIASVPKDVEPVVSNETVNVKLLEVAKRARKFAFSYAPHGGLLSELDEAIAAANQQARPELTDDEIGLVIEKITGAKFNPSINKVDIEIARSVIAAHEAKRGKS